MNKKWLTSIVSQYPAIQKKSARALIIGIVAFLAGCASREEKFSQNNPFDPGGDHWTINSAPKIIADIGSKPLWYDYDFQKDAGTVTGGMTAYDKNGIYDTLTITALLGLSPDSLDTVFTARQSALDTTLYFENLKPATTCHYTFIAVDTWDSSGTATGSWTTPLGRPPARVDSVLVAGNTSSISLRWFGNNGYTHYTLYRAAAKNGPFVSILDTVAQLSYVYYNDYVKDCSVYYYVIASANDYGECRSKKEICGYRYSTSISAPSYVDASDGSYTGYIYVSWGSVYNAVKYYIHRARTSSDIPVIIDSTPSTYYRDTLRDTSTQFCYRISAASSGRQRSAPSYDYDFGYVRKLGSPSGLSASDGTYESYIYITWSGVSGAAGYYVYRSLSYSGAYTLIGKTASPVFGDSVETMDYYYYKVAASDSSGRAGTISSYNSGYIYRTVGLPSSVSASQGAYEDYISVTWSSVVNAAGYAVYRSKTSIPDSFTFTGKVSSTYYTDSVHTEDTYYYAVAAYDTLGRTGPKSSYAIGYVLRLTAPSILSISKGSYFNYILIQWTSVTGANGYYIYRSDQNTGNPYELIDSTLSSEYRDSSITDTIPYYYRIAAYTAKGKISQQSSENFGYLKRFSYPADIVASQYEYKNKITLRWDPVPAATGYAIYRSTASSGVYYKIAVVTTGAYEDLAADSSYYYYYKVSSLKGALETAPSNYVIGYRLGPPLNFSAAGYSGYISLTWSSMGGTTIQGYYLYRSSDGISFARITVVNSSGVSSFRDSSIDYTKYYYKISSFSITEESDYSPVCISQKLPQKPLNLKAQSYTTHVALTWDPAAGAEGYNVYRGTTSSFQSFLAATQQPLYNDSSLTTSTKYYYTVSAVNKGGETLKSNYVLAGIIIKPSTPYNLNATGTTEHIYLAWAQNTGDDVTGYVIYRSADSGSTYLPLDTMVSKTFYDYVTSGRLYYYRVSAYNNAGESDKTGPVSARRLSPATPATVIIGSEQYTTHIPIKWSTSTGAAGYGIYRAVSADSNYQNIAVTPAAFYNDSAVLADTIYYYRISAYNSAGESALSGYVSGKKRPVQPSSVLYRKKNYGNSGL